MAVLGRKYAFVPGTATLGGEGVHCSLPSGDYEEATCTLTAGNPALAKDSET